MSLWAGVVVSRKRGKPSVATHARKIASRKASRALARKNGICNSCPRKARPNKRTCKHCGEQQRLKIAKARKDPACAELTRQGNHRSKLKLRKEVLDAYGGPVCKCCGEAHLEFLTIDHIEKPPVEAKQLGYRSGYGFYQWLRKNKYPPGFRVLCINCNFAHGHYGYCPHERERGAS